LDITYVARVIAVHKERYQLHSTEMGECYAQLKSSVYYQMDAPSFPTAGDWVNVLHNPYGDCLICDTLPRNSFFQRYDAFSSGRPQAIAANFDTVFILTSANHDFNPKRLHRYLSAARSSGANYAIIITKADTTDQIEHYLRLAEESAGESCPIFAISAAKGWGLAQVAAYLSPDSVSVFLGSSGIGKSTLVNALAGKNIMDVNGIREDDSKGRHTTTRRQMIRLDNGAWVLDTPGMREFGLADAEEGVSVTFSDIEELMQNCRFSNCTHSHEPGCAVKAAIESGRLSQSRWEEYQELAREAKRKAPKSPDETRQRLQRQKAISKFSREINKGRKNNLNRF